MNEASWRGTKLTRTIPATHWRVETSTTFPLASALIYLLLPGFGTYHSALLVCPALLMDVEQILIPWNLSSHWGIQSLHRSLSEWLCDLCCHDSMPFCWIFKKIHTIRGSSVWTLCPLLKTLYCNNMVQSFSNDHLE